MLLVNEILHGRYRILRQLGHGGMGAVYEAHDSVFDTTCALKEIMIAANSQNPKQQELILRAFEREAKILAKIKHEAVPHVRDYFTDGNRQFLVMELVEGKDLGGMLEERQSPFPLEDVLRWMEQLLDGLDYLHTQNPPIYHRDLKPQNLKITPRGKIKLLDFGIAKGGAEPPNSTTINNQTFVAATLNYSPIEQIFRVLDPVFREVLTQRFEARIQAVLLQNADARSDLYALGATVYHLLTGVLPIDALKRTIEVWSNKPDPLSNPISINNRIPPEISNLLLKAMEVDYDKRFASALEMQQALHQALANIKTREANQMENTLELSKQDTWAVEQERLRIIEAQRQQQTRLGTEQTFQDAATQQIPAEKLNLSQPPSSISEQTIQSGGIGLPQNFGQNTGSGAPPTPNSPFNTGGAPPFNTGGNQYQTGGVQQPTEMANFAGMSTGGNVPPPNFPPNSVSTGGAMNSNNPLQPNPAYAQNYVAQAPKKSSKIWWILPILLLLFLGVAGAGGGLFLWYQANNSGTTENVTPTPSVTVSASPTPASTSPTPVSTPSVSPTDNSGKGETPKPTVEPTNKPVTTPPVKPPPVKTQKPKIAPNKKNSDCIFTGDC
jgi:serine/threonine protein kinase